MNTKLTIVMYHYVRNLKDSRYPDIKGLDIDLFKKQIGFLKSKYNFISYEKLLDCYNNKLSLPENSILLTFDDGYIDHYTNVFPILIENNIQGVFAIPGKIIAENRLLDVNKIHFILASRNIDELINDVYKRLDYYRGKEFIFPSNDELYSKLAIANRFDNEKVIFVKRLLQNELDERLRNIITSELFESFIPISEKAFAKELYMNLDQVKLMKKSGMHFTIHGYDHYWLEKLPYIEMKKDISKALEVFDGIIDNNNWSICYPYGSYNVELLSYIKNNGCKLGFTTQVKIADYAEDILTLPRLDTNDFPPKSEKYLNID